jgi:hypothetical protein
MDPVQQLRASDFVIFSGTAKQGKNKGKAFEFARIDNRCPLMNNEKFIADLKANGTKVIQCN